MHKHNTTSSLPAAMSSPLGAPPDQTQPGRPPGPRPLSASRLVTLPPHVIAKLATTPTLERSYTGYAHRSYLAPDFSALFPSDQGHTRKGRRSYARTAVGAAALYLGVELAFDTVRISCGDCSVWGERLTVIEGESFHADDLLGVLPVPVVTWLSQHTREEAAAWMAMLLAEIQMHGLLLATGTWPYPHSTGSEMALHMAITQAVDWLEGVDGGETCMGIGELGGADDALHALDLLEGLLFEDHDVLWLDDPLTSAFAMGCADLHPRNWFSPFPGATNPWISDGAGPRTGGCRCGT